MLPFTNKKVKKVILFTYTNDIKIIHAIEKQFIL